MSYKTIVYLVYMGLILSAAYILYARPFGNRDRPLRKRILKEKIRGEFNKAKDNMVDIRLEQALYNAGNPFGLNALNFQLIRWSIILVWLISILSNRLILKNPLSLNHMALVILFFLSTMPMKNTPLIKVLNIVAKQHLLEKNKELFAFYSMIDNEFTTCDNKPLTMYSILNKLNPYFFTIKPAIGKAILLWHQGPAEALNAFAKEIGTPEAKDLANILKNVDSTSPKEALDLLQSRRETFLTMRHEIYRREQRNRGYRDYGITFASAMFVLFNMLVLFYQEFRDVMKFMSQN